MDNKTDGTGQSRTQIKVRMDGLDLLKAWSILMVIALHVPLFYANFMVEKKPIQAVQYVLRLMSEGVPIFIFVNGYLLFRGRELNLQKHFRKTGRIFVLMLLQGTIFCFTGTLWKVIYEHTSWNFNLRNLLRWLLGTNLNSDYTGILWFLLYLVGLYLVFPILKTVYDRDQQIFRYAFGLVALFTVGVNTLDLLIDFLNLWTPAELLVEFRNFVKRFSAINSGVLGSYLLFFMLGGMVRQFEETLMRHRGRWIALGFGAWGVSAAFGLMMSILSGETYRENMNFTSIFMPIWLIGLFVLTRPYQARNGIAGRLWMSLGRNTLGIYFIHIMVLWVVTSLIPYYTVKERVIDYVLVVSVSWILAVAVGKIPGLRRLVQL